MRAMLLALAGAGLAFGAAPPARLTPQQEALRQEEAITRMNRALQAQLRLTGPWHRATAGIASWLANWYQARREWRQEARAWGVMLEACRHLYGERYWRTVNGPSHL
jgi:hypothetical protein